MKTWLKEEVIRRLPDHAKRDTDIMKLRWVITWKTGKKDTRGKKLKAHLVVLGFQDPQLV